MAIKDYDGTTKYEIGKLRDYDGTTKYDISRVYDNDSTNDRLSNLMLITTGQNNAKRYIKEGLEKVGYPFFLWAERYDNTAIKMQAGYISQFKRPCFMVEGVFTVKQFLEEAQCFVDSAREQCTIFEEFDKLEK